MPLTTATVFVPDCRRMFRSTVLVPLMLAMVSASAMPSSTCGDVRDLDRMRLVRFHDDVAEFLDRLDAATGAQRDRAGALIHAPAGNLGVLSVQRARDVGDGDVVGAQPIGVEPRC